MSFVLASTAAAVAQPETVVTATPNAYLMPISEAAVSSNVPDTRKEQRIFKRRMDTALNTLRKKLQKTENPDLWFDKNLHQTVENVYFAQASLFHYRDSSQSNAQES